MTTGTGRFRRADRLLRSRDFRRVAGHGKRAAERHFVVLAVPVPHASQQKVTRLGITVSRKVGGAVVRNRLKRRIREWFRGARARLRPDMDIVVIARRGADQLAGQQLEEELARLMKSAEATR
jgi:ribonuclease P protein component